MAINITSVTQTESNFATYRHMLKGSITSASSSDLQIFINNHRSYGVIVQSSGSFTHEIFLADGKNEIILNRISKTTAAILETKTIYINVDIMPIEPQKQDLLFNFIGSDDENFELNTANADMKYLDKHAGANKKIKLDQEVQSHFFELDEELSELYRLDQRPEEIPIIQSDIIKRPIIVDYDYVEKVYDGTTDITPELKTLTLDGNYNGGYRFLDIQHKYNDFANTGFVRGTVERKSIIETLLRNTIIYINKNIDNFNITQILNNLNEGIYCYTVLELGLAVKYVGIINLPYIYSSILVEEFIVPIDVNNPNKYAQKLNECMNWLSIRTLPDTIQLDYTNIDVSTFQVILDDKIGFPIVNQVLQGDLWVIDPTKPFAEIIFKDSTETMTITQNGLLSLNGFERIEVKEKFEVNFKYLVTSTLNENIQYIIADKGYVTAKFDSAYFESKNITNELHPIIINNLQLDKDIKGDSSMDYQIAKYNSQGRITKRPIIAHIEVLDKIYDGSLVAPFKVNQLENSISGDNIFIDTTYDENRELQTHKFKKTGVSWFEFNDINVNTQWQPTIDNINTLTIGMRTASLHNNLLLEGTDAINYTLSYILSANAKIKPREVTLIITNLRFIRASKKWEIEYYFENDISDDNLTISFNTDDENDILVFDNSGNTDESIIPRYFSYLFDPNYQFMNPENEIKSINDQTMFWTDTERIAEPNTERIDITATENSAYEGDIKLTLRDIYYEDKNKLYKLHNKDMVHVTNIKLHPNNPKSKNYILMNPQIDCEINII